MACVFRKYPTEPADLFGKVGSEALSSESRHLIRKDTLPVLCSFKMVESDFFFFFFYWGDDMGQLNPEQIRVFLLVRRNTGF